MASPRPTFARYLTRFEAVARECRRTRKDGPDAFYQGLFAELDCHGDDALEFNAMAAEKVWLMAKRPFFRVWPGILEGFSKARLDVPINTLQVPTVVLSVELPDDGQHVRSILFGHIPRRSGLPFAGGFVVRAQFMHDDRLASLAFLLPWSEKKTVEDTIEEIRTRSEEHEAEILQHREGTLQAARQALLMGARIAICVSLIADDSRFVEAVCLSKDEPRLTSDNAAELQERAVRRGVFGWNIGHRIEVGPHVRRPHFGIRWCGTKKDGLKATLVPIKGSVVHRDKATSVPTGWHGNVVADVGN